MSDRNNRLISFEPVETDRNAVVHRKSNSRAVWRQLDIDDTREGLDEINGKTFEIQDDLLSREPPRKRGDLHLDMAHPTPKLVGVGKAKYLWRQDRRRSITAHSNSLKRDLRRRKHPRPDCSILPSRSSKLPTRFAQGQKSRSSSATICRFSIVIQFESSVFAHRFRSHDIS